MEIKQKTKCKCGAESEVIVNGQGICWDCANYQITALLDMGQTVTVLHMGVRIVLHTKPTGKTQQSFIGMN